MTPADEARETAPSTPGPEAPLANACVACGWGRLLFAQTFSDVGALVEMLRAEGPEQRDIAFYVSDPQVLLAAAPNELFLDPSHTFGLDLSTLSTPAAEPRGIRIRDLDSVRDLDEVNRILALHDMIEIAPSAFQALDRSVVQYYVAEDLDTGSVVGTVSGVDHFRAFGDPERRVSLWCLGVDMQTIREGVGEALVRYLAQRSRSAGARYLDLSVLHDNAMAIALYRRIGFTRLPFFAIKRRNSINERLFVGPDPAQELNPYARIIIDEARRRSIGVDVIDRDSGIFELSFGGRTIRCRESLTDLTSAVALSICDDKTLTRRIVERAGVRVPKQVPSSDEPGVNALLREYGAVVVKPAHGEQGRGVSVDLRTWDSVTAAIRLAGRVDDRVIVESYHPGMDLRLVVIGYRLVAAALRKPPEVIGDGESSIEQLILRQSRRRGMATSGESSIPIDEETARCVRLAGFELHDVPPKEHCLQVRKTANLHMGGTIHDVTGEVHPALASAAVTVARELEIPVVGVDFVVPSPHRSGYVFIEANERPGLANHEPQPTAQRFVDLLFPLSMPVTARGLHSSRRKSEHAPAD